MMDLSSTLTSIPPLVSTVSTTSRALVSALTSRYDTAALRCKSELATSKDMNGLHTTTATTQLELVTGKCSITSNPTRLASTQWAPRSEIPRLATTEPPMKSPTLLL